MKPNLVIVQSLNIHMDSEVEQFCEDFCDSHYVYLIRPGSEFREDSPAGVRFLGHALDSLPEFGSVETVISVADPEAAGRLRESYPESKWAVWYPGQNGDLIASILRPTVVRGDFGKPRIRDFARAM